MTHENESPADCAHSPAAEKGVGLELMAAGLGWFLAAALIFVFLFVLGLWSASHFFGVTIEKLGLAGDAFGGLTSLFNALAFAAVVVTVILQMRELKESREELKKQADAQRAWADAARKQISLTEQLEAVRIRPFIKAEWHPALDDPFTWKYCVRNVGLGVAVLTAYEIYGESGAKSEKFSEHSPEIQRQAFDAWFAAFDSALSAETPPDFSLRFAQFNDLNRALAPSELQAVLYLTIPGESRHRAFREIAEAVRTNFYFKSANGAPWATDNQFSDLQIP